MHVSHSSWVDRESWSSDLHFLGNFRVADLSIFDHPAIRFRQADDARKVFEMDKKKCYFENIAQNVTLKNQNT